MEQLSALAISDKITAMLEAQKEMEAQGQTPEPPTDLLDPKIVQNPVEPLSIGNTRETIDSNEQDPSPFQQETTEPSSNENKGGETTESPSLDQAAATAYDPLVESEEIKADLYQAYDWRNETEELEKRAIFRFIKFAKANNHLIDRCDDYKRCETYVRDQREELFAVEEVRRKQVDRIAARFREERAKQAVEEAKLKAAKIAEEARKTVLKAQFEYNAQIRKKHNAENERLALEGRRRQADIAECTNCGTLDVHRLRECPFATYHYIMDKDKKQSGDQKRDKK